MLWGPSPAHCSKQLGGQCTPKIRTADLGHTRPTCQTTPAGFAIAELKSNSPQPVPRHSLILLRETGPAKTPWRISPLYTALSCDVVLCSPLVHGTLMPCSLCVCVCVFLWVVGSLCVVFVCVCFWADFAIYTPPPNPSHPHHPAANFQMTLAPWTTCSKSRDWTAIAICDSKRESQITSDLRSCVLSEKSSMH